MSFPLLLLFFAGIILTAGDIVFKYWTGHNNPYLYVTGLVLYVIGLMFLVRSFKHEDIAIASLTMVLFNITTLTVVGWVFFKENITGFEIAGLFTGVLALLFFELG